MVKSFYQNHWDVAIKRLRTLNAMPASVYLAFMLDNEGALERTGDLLAQHFVVPVVGDGDWDKGWIIRHGEAGK